MIKMWWRIWFFLGSLVLIFVTSIVIIVVRITKLVMTRSMVSVPEADIFLDTRKQPLPPNLKSTRS